MSIPGQRTFPTMLCSVSCALTLLLERRSRAQVTQACGIRLLIRMHLPLSQLLQHALIYRKLFKRRRVVFLVLTCLHQARPPCNRSLITSQSCTSIPCSCPEQTQCELPASLLQYREPSCCPAMPAEAMCAEHRHCLTPLFLHIKISN